MPVLCLSVVGVLLPALPLPAPTRSCSSWAFPTQRGQFACTPAGTLGFGFVGLCCAMLDWAGSPQVGLLWVRVTFSYGGEKLPVTGKFSKLWRLKTPIQRRLFRVWKTTSCSLTVICEWFEHLRQGFAHWEWCGSSGKWASAAPSLSRRWSPGSWGLRCSRGLLGGGSRTHIWVTCSDPRYRVCHRCHRQGNTMQFGQEAEGFSPTTWKIFCLLLAQSHTKKDEVLITIPSFRTAHYKQLSPIEWRAPEWIYFFPPNLL